MSRESRVVYKTVSQTTHLLKVFENFRTMKLDNSSSILLTRLDTRIYLDNFLLNVPVVETEQIKPPVRSDPSAFICPSVNRGHGCI